MGHVDAVNVTDNQTAIVRMSSIGASALLQQMGLEPIMQMVCGTAIASPCRATFCGAYALGIRNVLCLSGDHQKFGEPSGRQERLRRGLHPADRDGPTACATRANS